MYSQIRIWNTSYRWWWRYTWNENSRLNRLTAFTNYASKDIPSELIYFIDNENKRFWTIGNRVVETIMIIIQHMDLDMPSLHIQQMG